MSLSSQLNMYSQTIQMSIYVTPTYSMQLCMNLLLDSLIGILPSESKIFNDIYRARLEKKTF